MEHRTREKLLYNVRTLHTRLFYLLLILLPSQLSYHFWPDFSFVNGARIDYLAPTVYFTDVITAGIGISWLFSKERKRMSVKNTHYALFALGVLYIVGNIFFAFNPLLAILKWITLGKLVLLTAYIVQTRPNMRTSFICILISASYTVVLAWAQFTTQSSIGGLWWLLGERTFDVSTPGIATAILNGKLYLRPYATFPHPNVLAGFMIMGIPLIWYSTVSGISRIKVPLLIIAMLTLFITFSRSGWLIFGIQLATMSIHSTYALQVRSLSKKALIICLLVGICLAPLAAERMMNLASVDRQSITRRMDLHHAAIAMARDNILFGVGLNNFLPSLPDYTTIRSYQDMQPAHNIYVLFLAESGIVGILLVGVLLAKFLPVTLQALKNFRFRYVVSFFSIALLGLFDHYPYTIHQVQLVIAVFTGFILYKHEHTKKSS